MYKAISYTVRFRQSKTALFDWAFFRLDSSGPSSYRQSSRFYSFCTLPRGGWCEGVLLYGSRKSVGSSGFRAFFASNACLARDEPSSWRWAQPKAAKATFVALHSAESRQSYRVGVAVVGQMILIPRGAAINCMIHAAGGRSQGWATLTCSEKQQQ